MRDHLPWRITYSWQVLYFSAIEPVTKDRSEIPCPENGNSVHLKNRNSALKIGNSALRRYKILHSKNCNAALNAPPRILHKEILPIPWKNLFFFKIPWSPNPEGTVLRDYSSMVNGAFFDKQILLYTQWHYSCDSASVDVFQIQMTVYQ